MIRRLLRRLIRLMFPALSFAIGAAVMLLFLSPAHADPIISVTPTGIELSWQGWLMTGIVVAGSALKILDVVLAALKIVAPRTKTTLDDRMRDGVQVVDTFAHDKLDAILKVVGGLVPAAGVPVTTIGLAPIGGGGVAGSTTTISIAAQPRDSQAGVARFGLLAGVSIAGFVAVIAMMGIMSGTSGCATTKAALAEGTVAFLECEDGHLDAQALADMKTTASAELRHLIAGRAAPDPTALKADLAPLKSDLARCGWAAAIAGLGVLLHPTPGVAVSALVELGPDPVAVRDQARLVMRDLGWPRIKPVKAPDGPVL